MTAIACETGGSIVLTSLVVGAVSTGDLRCGLRSDLYLCCAERPIVKSSGDLNSDKYCRIWVSESISVMRRLIRYCASMNVRSISSNWNVYLVHSN